MRLSVMTFIAAATILHMVNLSVAAIPEPVAWWNFDNSDGLDDGIVLDQGGGGIDLLVDQWNGRGGQPRLFFQAGETANPAPEHYIDSGATFPNAGQAYHMEGGTHRTYDDGFGGPNQDASLDPRTTSVLNQFDDIFSWRDRLEPQPKDGFDELGGKQVTYAFWMNTPIPQGNLYSRRTFGNGTFLIGRRSDPELDDGAFGGQVRVVPDPSQQHPNGDPSFVLELRNDGPNGIQKALGAPFKPGEWHHYVVGYDLTGDTGTVTVYQDGEWTDTLTGFGNAPIGGSFSLNQVAWNNASFKESGDFQIDDLGVWTGVNLTPDDVKAIYEQGISGAMSFVLGDLTRNGFVDFEDLTILLANWNKDVTAADGNLVEPLVTVVNFDDLTVLLAEWTGPGPTGSPEAELGANAAVPEPSTMVLAILGWFALVGVRRRRYVGSGRT